MRNKLLAIFLLLTFYSATSGIVMAQSSIPTNDATTAANVAETATGTPIPELTKERETQRIKDLRTLYRDQVEVYRNSEKAYIIAKTNYEQVQTLASLEEAVKATQTVMYDRSRVLITYLELVDAVLIETNGIELDLKEQSHTEMFGVINAIKIHQENILISKDRQAMVFLADEFEPIAFSYQSSVYKALSLIRIGKIQEVHDKSEIIEVDIQKEHELQDVSEAKISRRNRAYAQVEQNFDLINQNLADLNVTFTEGRRDGFTRGFYEAILEDLAPIYAQISKSLDHLEELITL